MLGFIIGLIIGGTAGVFTMALCTAAGQADKRGDSNSERIVVSLLVKRR